MNHLPTPLRSILILAAVAALSACASSSPDLISRHQTQRLAQIQDATVISVRPVRVEGTQSGLGASAGGVVGAIAGSSVGGRRESVAIGVLGAVAGAVVGNAMERASTQENAIEIVLQLGNGERRAIVQAQGGEKFQPGDFVTLITSGGKTRVTKGNSEDKTQR